MKFYLHFILVLLSFAGVSCSRTAPQLSQGQLDSLNYSIQTAATESDFEQALAAMKEAYGQVRPSGDPEQQIEVLSGLIPMMLRAGEYEECLHLSLDAVRMAKEVGDTRREALFNFYLGMYFMDMEDQHHADLHIEEGLRLSANVKDGDFSVRYIQGNVLAVLFNNGKFDSVIKMGRSILSGLTSEERASRKGDAIYAQVSAMLACCYQVLVNEEKAAASQLDSAAFFEDAYNSTEYASRDKGQKLRNYYVAAGKNEQARALLFSELDQLSMSDTVSLRYYRTLKALAGTYSQDGQYKDAYDFQSRAIQIKDTLDRKDILQRSMDYENRMRAARNSWENSHQKQSSTVFFSLFTFAVIIIFLLMLFMILNARKARALEKKNKMLAASVAAGVRKDEIIGILSSSDDAPLDEDLYYYRQIERITEEKKLYLDKAMTRDILLQEYNVPKARIPKVLSKYAGVETLNEYINTKRLNHAASLLIENNGMKLIDVARNSGFSNTTTMYRLFMKHYDMSPSEYVKRYRAAVENGGNVSDDA